MTKAFFIFAALISLAEDHALVATERTRIPASVSLEDSAVFKGREQVTFAIKKNGKTPEKRVFDKTWKQRRLAGLAKTYMGDTSSTPGMVVKFEAIQLVVDPRNENKFFLVVRTMGKQRTLGPSADRALLESGETLTFREHKVKDVLSVGQVTADLVVQIRFNSETGKITLPYVAGAVKVSSVLSEESDSAEVRDCDCVELKEK